MFKWHVQNQFLDSEQVVNDAIHPQAAACRTMERASLQNCCKSDSRDQIQENILRIIFQSSKIING